MEDEDLIDCKAQASYLLPTPNPTVQMLPAKAKCNLGKALVFTCRSKIKVTGKVQPNKPPAALNSNLTLRENEALSALLEKLGKAHQFDMAATKFTMFFDGDKLDLEKTPKQYEMENEDLIDFLVEVESWTR